MTTRRENLEHDIEVTIGMLSAQADERLVLELVKLVQQHAAALLDEERRNFRFGSGSNLTGFRLASMRLQALAEDEPLDADFWSAW